MYLPLVLDLYIFTKVLFSPPSLLFSTSPLTPTVLQVSLRKEGSDQNMNFCMFSLVQQPTASTPKLSLYDQEEHSVLLEPILCC